MKIIFTSLSTQIKCWLCWMTYLPPPPPPPHTPCATKRYLFGDLFSFNFVFLSIILVVSATCEEQWKSFGSSCYKKHSSQGWRYARLNCQNFGGKLVKIESEDENKFIKTQYLSGGGGRYWIGLSDIDNEGDWRWTDGTGIAGYEKWRSGQPNNYENNQHCGAILKGKYYGANYNAEWNDEKCSLTLDYICEKWTSYALI